MTQLTRRSFVAGGTAAAVSVALQRSGWAYARDERIASGATVTEEEGHPKVALRSVPQTQSQGAACASQETCRFQSAKVPSGLSFQAQTCSS